MSDPPNSLVGTTLLGRYKIRGLLGQGGMGIVYAAKHLPTGRNVALKILTTTAQQRKSALRRFEREARTAALIGRPHVAEILEAGRLESGEAFIAMEQLTGETLRQRLDRSVKLDFADIASTFTQLLTALAAVHGRGLVHRDIKPDNIFFARSDGDGPPVIKLIDFGVVKLTDPTVRGSDDEAPITHTGIVVGTPAYVSPEQILSPKAVDGRADLWAVGVCLYEAVTGTLPFLASAAPLVMLDILHKAPPAVRSKRPDCPPALETLIHRALEKVPDKRFPDALTFRRALLAFWSEQRTTFQRPKRVRDPGSEEEDTEPSSEVVLPIVDLAKFADLTPIPTASPPPRKTRPPSGRTPRTERKTPNGGRQTPERGGAARLIETTDEPDDDPSR